MTPQEKKREQRLLKRYGINLAEYETKLKHQGGVCAICRRTPIRNLDVDHDHRHAKQKVFTEKRVSGWWAGAGLQSTAGHKTRRDAVQEVRLRLLRSSIRGLLCHSCNRGLRYFRDNPAFFQVAAEYLLRFNRGVSTY